MTDKEKNDEDVKEKASDKEEDEKEGKRYSGGVIPKSRSTKKNDD